VEPARPRADIVDISFERKCDRGETVRKKIYKKNRYKEWLPNAIDLALYVGVRLEQIAVLKWSDISCNETGEPLFIESNNLKVNRQQNWNKTKEEKIDTIAISVELRDLLYSMGLNENRGKDKYLIAPFEKCNRETIVKQMSAGFSFYRDKVGVSKTLCFENLRKTYLNHMKMLQNRGNNIKVSSHSRESVLEDHYYDAQFLAEQTTKMNFSLYGND